MTINKETERRAGPFLCDGVQTTFPFKFKVFDESQVQVLISTDGLTDTVLDSAEYFVQLDSDPDNESISFGSLAPDPDKDDEPGGVVTLYTPPPSGTTLSILSAVPYTQTLNLTSRGGFYPSVINAAFDRCVAQIQQLKERIDRTLKVAATSSKTPEQLIIEILDTAAKANEFAKQSLEVLQSVQQSEQNVNENKEIVLAAKEFVDASRARVEELSEVVEDNQERLAIFKENVDDFHIVVDNAGAIRAIASDLQGFPIEGFDGGWTDEADEVLVGVGGVMRDCAENIEAIKTIAEALEGVMNLEDLEAEVTEIGSTDYVKINNTGSLT